VEQLTKERDDFKQLHCNYLDRYTQTVGERNVLQKENDSLHHFVDEVDNLFENVKRERVGKQ
jgi:hypothetical protein